MLNYDENGRTELLPCAKRKKTVLHCAHEKVSLPPSNGCWSRHAFGGAFSFVRSPCTQALIEAADGSWDRARAVLGVDVMVRQTDAGCELRYLP
jgi:hypothetical protein